MRSTFFSLHVIGRACSHQALDHLRPPGATFSRFGITPMCWLNVLVDGGHSFPVMLSLGATLVGSDLGGGEPTEV